MQIALFPGTAILPPYKGDPGNDAAYESMYIGAMIEHPANSPVWSSGHF